MPNDDHPREIEMTTANYLTDEQRKAVSSQDRVFMLLGPAGSGKTRVLINRIIKIFEDNPQPTFRILAVTHTSKAAEEIGNIITKVVGEQSWRFEAKTIHSFVLEWLRNYGGLIGVNQNVVVHAEDIDRFKILQNYLDTLGEPPLDGKNMKQIFDKFDQVRSGDIPVDSLPDSPAFGIKTTIREMYDAYLASLREAGGIDSPGILYQFLELLKLDPSLVDHLQRVYKHVLVDECQYLSKVQSEILKTMVGDKSHLFAVGDEGQAINSWADGEIDNAYYLVGTNATKEKILHNFRCARQILSLANRVANHFSNPKNKTIIPENTPLGYFDYKQANNEEDESIIVAKWVQELLDNGLDERIIVRGESNKIYPEDIGVIGRTKYALDEIHSRLQDLEIPLSILTETNDLLFTPEARLLLALVEINNYTNNLPAIRKASQELDNFANIVTNNAEEVWGNATKFLPEIVSVAQSENLNKFGNKLENISVDNNYWNEDTQRLLKWLDYYRHITRPPNRSFQGLINFILRSQRTLPTDRGVRLLTAHRAKGLEFRAVAVIGLNQRSFPHYRNLELPELDVERRAFYVSITRASRTLLLTRPQIRTYRSGEMRVQEPSQFLKEAGIL